LLALAAVVGPTRAVAGPARRVDLAWSQDDPSCLDAKDLTAVVERTLGRPVFHTDAVPSARVTGHVGRAGEGRFEAHVAIAAGDGKALAERMLATQGDCGRLDEAIALVVTLMIDSVEESPTPLTISPLPVRAAAPPPAASRPPILLSLGLEAGFAWSLLPGATGSVGLRGEIAPRGFVPIALTVRAYPFDSILVGGVGGKFSAWTAELAACPRWSNDRVRVGGCVGFAGGTIDGSELNLLEGESHVRPLLLVTAMPFVAVRLGGPVWTRLQGGLWFPLLRDPWGYLNTRNAFVEIFRPGVVIPAAALTFELQSGSSGS
jgi:hypothetical protein